MPGPPKADVILRVNRHRGQLRAILHTLFRLGHKTPHLPASKAQAVIQRHLAPELPLAQRIAVALAVIGGDGGGQEVRFVVARKFGTVGFAFSKHRDAGLPGRGVEFGHFAQVVSRERNAGEGRVDVCASSALAENGFGGEESTWC